MSGILFFIFASCEPLNKSRQYIFYFQVQIPLLILIKQTKLQKVLHNNSIESFALA